MKGHWTRATMSRAQAISNVRARFPRVLRSDVPDEDIAPYLYERGGLYDPMGFEPVAAFMKHGIGCFGCGQISKPDWMMDGAGLGRSDYLCGECECRFWRFQEKHGGTVEEWAIHLLSTRPAWTRGAA